MSTLLRLPPGKEEPLLGYLSRMAKLNGCPTLDLFLRHLEIAPGDAVRGRDAAFEAVKRWFDTDTSILRSNSIIHDDDGFHLSGQTLLRPLLRRERLHVCLKCLQEDMASGDQATDALPYCRAHWLLEPIYTCPTHHAPLFEIANDRQALEVHDFSGRVAHLLWDEALTSDMPSRAPTALETYILDRLAGRQPQTTWIDQFPLYAAIKVCQLIGAVSLNGPELQLGRLTSEQLRLSGHEGYQIAKEGVRGIDRLLGSLKGTYLDSRKTWGPRYTYGRLYEVLAHETDDPIYDPLRQAIRDFTIAHFPVGPGEMLLGQQITRRAVHSVHTASLETGLHPKRLCKQLLAAGLIAKSDLGLPYDRILFSAEKAAPLLADLTDSLKLKEVGPYLNIPRAQMMALDKGGLLEPCLSMETGNGRAGAYSRRMLDAFLAQLLEGAEMAPEVTETRVTVPIAAKRANCSAVEIIKLIQNGKLAWKGRLTSAEGYLSVLVDYEEVRRLVKRADHGGVTLREAEKLLGVNTRVLAALIDQGHLPYEVVINPVNRCPQRIVRQDQIEAFTGEFVNLARLGKERGVYLGALRKELDALAVSPAISQEDVGATFYRRSEIARPKFAEKMAP